MLEKVATIKGFEYSPLGKELKAQTGIGKKQYQKVDNTFEFDKIIKKEKPTIENYSKSNLIYDTNHSFYLSFKSKHSFLNEFFDDLDKLNNVNPKKKRKREKK